MQSFCFGQKKTVHIPYFPILYLIELLRVTRVYPLWGYWLYVYIYRVVYNVVWSSNGHWLRIQINKRILYDIRNGNRMPIFSYKLNTQNITKVIAQKKMKKEKINVQMNAAYLSYECTSYDLRVAWVVNNAFRTNWIFSDKKIQKRFNIDRIALCTFVIHNYKINRKKNFKFFSYYNFSERFPYWNIQFSIIRISRLATDFRPISIDIDIIVFESFRGKESALERF